MEFTSVCVAVRDIVYTMRSLEVEQVLRYFREAASREDLIRYIVQHIESKTFECPGFIEPYLKMRTQELTEDKFIETVKACKITMHRAHWVRSGIASVSKRFDIQDILTSAFWPVAEIGCQQIKEVVPVDTPRKTATIIFSTMDKQHYDLTWCFIHSTIAEAAKEWDSCSCEQTANHIALVKSSELGKAALDAGFDSYCILDQEKHPQYFVE